MKYIAIAALLGLAACGTAGGFDIDRPVDSLHSLVQEYTGADKETQCNVLNEVRAYYPEELREFLISVGSDRVVCPDVTVTVVQ